MDASGNSKRYLRPKKSEKLKFRPKVPAQKPKKSTPEKKQEEPKSIDEELVKRLRTGKGAAKTLTSTKDEISAHNSPNTPSSGVSLSMPHSGKHELGQPMSLTVFQRKKALQIPRVFCETANPGIVYDSDSDDDEDDDGSDELLEAQLSSTECESSICAARDLNLLEENSERRMFVFQFPKSLPLLRMPTIIERNGKTVDKEVKEGYNMKDLPEGYLGKMRVYKSGNVKMKLGDVMFDVNTGVECGMAQHVVAINTRGRHCCLLGEIKTHHVVVTPDVDSLLNDNSC